MSNNFQLNFESSDSNKGEDEEEDDYWKNNGKNKFNKPIFSESDSDESESSQKIQTLVKGSAAQIKNVENKDSNEDFIKKTIQNEETKSENIGKTFLYANPISNRALNTSQNTNSSVNSSIGSSNSSITNFIPEYSVRSRSAQPQNMSNEKFFPKYEPKLQAPIPKPKFTLPATIIQNSAFNKPKESTTVFNIPKENNNESSQFPDNKNTIKENIELRTKCSKLEAELKLLTSKLEDKPDFKNTINRFMLNKPYWFDLYKNKRDKITLLNEAIDSHDGNAILAVTLFIKRTLTRDSFHSILINHPIALNQYIFHLEQINDQSEIASFYKYHGNINESASINTFKPILLDKKQEIPSKIVQYNDFEKNHTSVEINLIDNSGITLNATKKYIKLLHIQRDILKNNSAFLRKDKNRQISMDSLKQNSLAYTVSFCLKFNRELNDHDSYSIENLKKEFDLSTKQFSIWFIKSMSEIGSWTELENYTKQRGIFNMVKNPPVAYETIVFIISHVKGPGEQIKKYLNLVENVDRRQILGLKFKQTDVVIDTFKIQRDKIGLYNYRNQFRENTPDYIKANIVLMDHDKVKWKN